MPEVTPPVPEVYTNAVQVAASPTDIALVLGLTGYARFGGVTPDAPTTVAIVRMSPQAAKLLAMSLSEIISIFEERFSKIDLAESFSSLPVFVERVVDGDQVILSVVRPAAIVSFGVGNNDAEAERELIRAMREESTILEGHRADLDDRMLKQLEGLRAVLARGHHLSTR